MPMQEREGGALPAADFAFSNKTNHLNLNKQEHPFQLKKIPGCESFPQTLCASKTALSPFLEWEMVPSGFSPPGLLRFLPQFFHHRCCAAARWWGRVLVGVTSSAATHALAKGGSDL